MKRYVLDVLWILLGAVTLFGKGKIDGSIWKNEGAGSIDAAIAFTNRVPIMDSILWIGFTVFGALFVMRRLEDRTVLYPLFTGRMGSRSTLIARERKIILLWSAVFLLISAVGSFTIGSLSLGTIFSYVYAWVSLSLLIMVLRLLQDGVRQAEGAYTVWLFLLLGSSLLPKVNEYAPWMYGNAYFIWQHAVVVPSLLLVLTCTIVSVGYMYRMKAADWA
ncbi:hypothetical protein A374_06921 [Fictibacillus macauensis ZFHKF-1]|uniref:Uncharacterized protein n=1 Tax=Fictibacillus macauensis ZFHKF-1 TaxID=1196324 RepID=I8AJS0_9BACL|nr:hypothetical protein [Fictibacillus macauensis]EIT86032.1 hypothetical protein A374_06921 [Fictibacillus macauensis ZFHKF-1]